MSIESQQRETCRRFGAEFVPTESDCKLGIALQTLSNLPIHGLRRIGVGDTCGWYVWAGVEMSEESEFFQPLHVVHLGEHCPTIIPYLGLVPGWRFLLKPDHEDVWFDASIVHE